MEMKQKSFIWLIVAEILLLNASIIKYLILD
jgi:hypothetical protein